MKLIKFDNIKLNCTRYHTTREKRACESVEDAENKIVTLLQDKFLHLLADFRYLHIKLKFSLNQSHCIIEYVNSCWFFQVT